jgi:hypothetical protein
MKRDCPLLRFRVIGLAFWIGREGVSHLACVNLHLLSNNLKLILHLTAVVKFPNQPKSRMVNSVRKGGPCKIPSDLCQMGNERVKVALLV